MLSWGPKEGSFGVLPIDLFSQARHEEIYSQILHWIIYTSNVRAKIQFICILHFALEFVYISKHLHKFTFTNLNLSASSSWNDPLQLHTNLMHISKEAIQIILTIQLTKGIYVI